ncbi:MAG: prepilin-type N-terminal cleavage/methylation domain-containing protein [Planctomycetota bacterium]|nr:prepilin-type N-terminal cleavage/methylation domain-containing protein [Planctomycetota bacterium]
MIHRWLRLQGRQAEFRAVAFPSRAWKRGGRSLRFAFTLMELMIALGLLGALMAVAWSLMGTFGNAEIRGWKLAHRVQTIRSARVWLESDMQHLALSVSPTDLNIPSLSEGPQFTGDSLGFTATIAPSVDPIPFLENLMSDAMGPEQNNSATVRSPRMQSPSIQSPSKPFGKRDLDYSATRDADDAAPSTIWPAETIEIEYRLTPTSTNSARPLAALAGNTNTDDTQFVLTRREMMDSQQTMTFESPSERVLSTQDLYGRSDETMMSSRSPFRESRLEGLTKVQFHYFDGNSWISEWNSVQQGGLPIAIAFGFDFPAVSDMKPPSSASVKRSEQGNSMIDNGSAADLSFDSAALVTETSQLTSQNNQGMMESSSNEVQIVVFVGKRSSKSKNTSIQSRQRDIP